VLDLRRHHGDANEWHNCVLTSELGRVVHEEADLSRARIVEDADVRAETRWVQPQVERHSACSGR
jgi:hypothetical protein